MNDDIFVISDLHMGGKPGFQMLSPAGQAKLADFSRWLAERQADPGLPRVHLVLAGDVVDFLAEEPWEALTAEAPATTKFERIIASTAPVWDAWAKLLESGGQVSLMLGNHDVELCYPRVIALLRRRLGAGQLDLIFDNQALIFGDVLIEHGNRYDSWNRVQHDQLRAIRSAASRREDVPLMATQPGSELVVQLINPMKEEVDFIDLLKPERGGLLPLLSALAPARAQKALAFLSSIRVGRHLLQDRNAKPTAAAYISAGAPSEDAPLLTREELDLSRRVAGLGPSGAISGAGPATAWLHRWDQLSPKRQSRKLKDLLESIRARKEGHLDEFNADIETGDYATQARSAVEKGFRVVIYGHTHAVRRERMTGGLYLNTGTWADLMRFPESIFGQDDELAVADLRTIVIDMVNRRTSRWRFQYPTFAWLPESDPTRADVHLYTGNGTSTPVPSGYRRDLRPREPT